mmetsp:Transcript_14620/g.37208  ORF Transcript_14620/g.37208 Transcript_14620/m.37208 type:complete len:282 (+) Transcript_14620:15-860(+)
MLPMRQRKAPRGTLVTRCSRHEPDPPDSRSGANGCHGSSPSMTPLRLGFRWRKDSQQASQYTSPALPLCMCLTSRSSGAPMQSSCEVHSGWPAPPSSSAWSSSATSSTASSSSSFTGSACAFLFFAPPAPLPPTAPAVAQASSLPSSSASAAIPTPPFFFRLFLLGAVPPFHCLKRSLTTIRMKAQSVGGRPSRSMRVPGKQLNGSSGPKGLMSAFSNSISMSSDSPSSLFSRTDHARLIPSSSHLLTNVSMRRWSVWGSRPYMISLLILPSVSTSSSAGQ